MVCMQIRLITPVKTRDIKAIQNAINTCVTNVGPPKVSYSDKESSILHLVKSMKDQLRKNLYQKQAGAELGQAQPRLGLKAR